MTRPGWDQAEDATGILAVTEQGEGHERSRKATNEEGRVEAALTKS